jgi:hypothetical protein
MHRLPRLDRLWVALERRHRHRPLDRRRQRQPLEQPLRLHRLVSVQHPLEVTPLRHMEPQRRHNHLPLPARHHTKRFPSIIAAPLTIYTRP